MVGMKDGIQIIDLLYGDINRILICKKKNFYFVKVLINNSLRACEVNKLYPANSDTYKKPV